MTEENTGIVKNERSGMFLLMLHGLCLLLVVLYVNMFQFWAWLSRALGPGILAKMLPVLVTAAVLLIISLRFVQQVNKGHRIRFFFLGLGIIAAFIALAIPDPKVPIKRIHVAEYILLAFAVRYVLSHRLGGVSLFLFTALATALYGIHDEMMQGLHSLRYYGWRDIIVNAVAGLSGAMLSHGLILFDTLDARKPAWPRKTISFLQVFLFGCLFTAVIWQIMYLYSHRAVAGILIGIVPVATCCLIIGGLNKNLVFDSKENHGLQITYWLAFGLVAYPLLAVVTGLEFR